MHCIYIKM